MNIFTSIILANNSGGNTEIQTDPDPEPPEVGFLTDWNRRKQFSVSATIETESILELSVYNTSGTDTTTAVYLGGNVRADWGDVRFTTEDGTTRIPYAILRKESDHILVAVNLGVVQNGDFFIYYDGPAQSLFKLAHLTDVHYCPGETLDNRQYSLDFIDSFVTRMATYLPDLAAHSGDKIGALDTNESNRLGYYQDTVDHFAAVSVHAGDVMDGLAPGNHDFDFTSFANILAIHSGDTWMESGTLYGAKEVGDFLIVSLDANYIPSGQSHRSLSHQGYGYVNTNQLTWLTNTLAAATKRVIVFCHQPLSEMDTAQFTLTKETYHTQNRHDVRNILEASNKVVCCIHGHTHYSRNDVINGIPYITITNIGNSGQFGEQPGTNTGKWGLLDFDISAKTIRVRTEAIVSSVVQLIYDQTLAFGSTSFDGGDIANNHEAVYAGGFLATYEKASFLRDPVQAYVTNAAHLYKYPANLNIPDVFLSDNTIKVNGRTNTPNFGRIQWYISPETGIMRIRFDCRLSSVKTKQIKFGDSNIVSLPAFRIHFNNDGNISAHDGATLTNVRTYSANTWYKFEIIANVTTDTFSLWIDDVLEAEDFAFTNTSTSINRAEVVTETGNIFIDSLRKYKYTDITISTFETEETAP